MAALNAASLPATAGKTGVPTRTVTTVPAPKAKAPVAAKPQRPARPTPTQNTTPPAVQQLLAPLYAQQNTQAQAQNAAIRNYTQAIISQLQGVPSQVQGDYNNAISAQSALAGSAADALRNANPNQQDQQLLQALNAPAAQQAQIAGQDANTFNGGAATGLYLNGVLPMDTLRSQALTATTLARLQPGYEGLRGQQALAGALYQQGQDRQKIDAMAPDLTQKYQAAQTAAAQKQAYLDIAAQSLGLKAQNQQFSQGLAATKLSVQQKQFVARQQQQVALFNSRQKTAAAKLALPDAGLSGKVGYLVDSAGTPIGGKITPLPGFRIYNGQVVKQGTKAKSSKLSAFQVQKFKGTAAMIAIRGKNGFDGVDPVTKKPKHFPPLSPADAWKHMRMEGIPETIAIAALNRAYGTNFNASGFLP